MKCNEIVEKSLKYLEFSLCQKEKKNFLKHLQTCNNCQQKFQILAANYEANISTDTVPDFKAQVMEHIHPGKYPEKAIRPKYAKWAVIAAVLVLFIGATANAQSIYKSLEELVSSMRPTNEYQKHLEKAAGDIDLLIKEPVSISYEDLSKMYTGIEQNVLVEGERLLPGEYKELSYTELHEGFYVKIAKLSNYKLTIGYGIKGGPSIGRGEHEYQPIQDEKWLQKVIDDGYFIAVPTNLPEQYFFYSINIEDGRVNSMDYRDKENHYIAMSFEHYSLLDFEEFETSLVEINGRQAIYSEDKLNGTTIAILNLFLGDNRDKKVLSISGNALSKEELFHIAESMIYYNEDSNMLTEENYFKAFKDSSLESIYDDVISREKAGEKLFTIYISGKKGDKNIVRFDKNDAGPGGWCMINYIGIPYNDLCSVLNYPLLMDKSILDTFTLDGISVASRPYEEVKRVHYTFTSKEGKFNILSVTAIGLPVEKKRYTIIDLSLMRYVLNDAELTYNQTGHPYIIRHLLDNQNIAIETIIEVEGRYVSYAIIAPKEVYSGIPYNEIISRISIVESF